MAAVHPQKVTAVSKALSAKPGYISGSAKKQPTSTPKSVPTDPHGIGWKPGTPSGSIKPPKQPTATAKPAPYWDAGYGDFNGRGTIGVSQYKPRHEFDARSPTPPKNPHANQHYVPGKAAVPGKPAHGAPPVDPFLTPQQQLAQIKETAGWEGTVQGLNRALSDSTANTQNTMWQTGRNAAIAARNNNSAMAGRGMFNSGVHLSDLADINTNLNLREGILQSRLQTLAADTARKIGQADFNHGISTGQYAVQATQNAEAQQPNLTMTPAVPGTPATPGQWANNVKPGFVQQPGTVQQPAPTAAGQNMGESGTVEVGGTRYTTGGFGTLGSARPTPNPQQPGAIPVKPAAPPPPSMAWGRQTSSAMAR